jgi:hypothetical protein
LRLSDGHIPGGINIFDVDQLFALGGHNHKRRRVLVYRNDFIYQIRVIAALQVQHSAGGVEQVERGKTGIEKPGNLPDAYCGNALNIKAVNLPRQRRYLLKQRNALVAAFGSLIRVYAVSSHNIYMLIG